MSTKTKKVENMRRLTGKCFLLIRTVKGGLGIAVYETTGNARYTSESMNRLLHLFGIHRICKCIIVRGYNGTWHRP